MKKCVVIYNPHSGRYVKKNFLAEMVDILLDYEYDPDIVFSKYRGHIYKIVTELPDDVDLVISIGGDGTFNESMNGNLKREHRLLLSHIPLGTTNDIGKMFGYGKNIISNLHLLLNGVEEKMDICTVNKKAFVYSAGFGKFLNVSYETTRNKKEKLGYFAYLMEGLKEALKETKLYDITYEVDGNVYQGLYSFLLIGNATRIAGVNNIFYDVKLDDDRFEVLFSNLQKKKDIIKTLNYLRKTDITRVPGFYFHRTNYLKVTFHDNKKVPWCIDGEKMESDTNTFEVEVVKDIRIMIPKKNADKLFEK